MHVKFYDVGAQYRQIKKEIDEAIAEVLENASFYDSPSVSAFEAAFAQCHQTTHCIAVNSGTSALHATLMALEIGFGDEVLVPVNTFFATAEAVSLTGATPVFVDCNAEDYGIDPKHLARHVTARTKALIVVHMYGQAVQLAASKAFSEQHGLHLIEDCAHAHLATYDHIPVGTFGIASCFSFFPGKNLGAYGEGGAILTSDERLAEELIKIRQHGAIQKYHHDRIGHNYRMEGIQAAILNVKLRYIMQWTAIRQERAALYHKLLRDCLQLTLPQTADTNQHVYHLFVILCQDRDTLRSFLGKKGIETGLHYPIPLHLQKAYASLGYQIGDFPVAERLSKEMLSLPISEQLSEEEVRYIANCIQEFYAQNPHDIKP